MMRGIQLSATRAETRPGAILILASFCMVIVMVFLAFAIDWGYIVLTDSELQNAADSGALSGARALSRGNKIAIAAAQSWAGKNTAGGQSVAVVADDVELGLWDESKASFTALAPTSTTLPNAVRVTCQRTSSRGNPLNLFFAPVIGRRSVDVKKIAVARVKTSRCALIIGIPYVTMSGSSHTDSYNSEEGPYSSARAYNRGHVCSNGTITMSGSTAINGDAHPGPNMIVKSSSSVGVLGTISPLKNPLAYPPADPGNAATINDNSKIPLSMYKKSPLNVSQDFTLSGGDMVSLLPGTYYFRKISLSGGSTIKINGPTIIYATGDVSLSGGSVANLTYLPKNLQLFPMGSKCVISGGSEFYGLVYAPNTHVERSGSSDYFGAIIAGELVLSGSGGIHADESLDSQIVGGAVQTSTLVE